MKVLGYSLPQVMVSGVCSRLYPHQAVMFNEWDQHDAFALITKTGSGKTRAVALPILKKHESAIFVYPTNALISDQARSIMELMSEEEISYRELTPQNADEKSGDEEYILVQINAEILKEFCLLWHMSQKGDALLRLLQSDKRKIILVNPDILFLILSLKYGRASTEVLSYAQAFSTIVFDEFHLYHGIELAHILFMIFLARQMNIFKRVVLLSATPDQEVMAYINKLLHPRIINIDIQAPQQVIGDRIVAHDVDLRAVPVDDDLVKTAASKTLELIDQFRALRQKNQELNVQGKYVPCIVILNSVINAIALEDMLVESGVDREDIAPIRGLSARSSRDTRRKLIVIGTPAIEVGIDFRADYLLFQGGDASSFLQRFGRIARHQKGVAILLGDYRECEGILSFGDVITRDELEAAVSLIYPLRDVYAWFVTTFGGFVTVCSMASNFNKVIMADKAADNNVKQKILAWMDDLLERYAVLMESQRVLKQVRNYFKREHLWLKHYSDIQSFRTSLPSQTVWDRSERERDREWEYKADVKTLLLRAESICFKSGKLYVKGYGKLHKVRFGKSFEEKQSSFYGTFQTTACYEQQDMQFIRDNHSTPVSHVMYKPKHHIFVVIPYEEVKAYLDWRIAWFWCGESRRNIVAFDGDALLLREIWIRNRQS